MKTLIIFLFSGLFSLVFYVIAALILVATVTNMVHYGVTFWPVFWSLVAIGLTRTNAKFTVK
jgi:hypothetical protein